MLFTELWDAGQALTTTFRCGADAREVLTWTLLDELRHYNEEIAVMAEAAHVRIHFPSPNFRNMPTPIVVEGMEGEASWIKTVTSCRRRPRQERLHLRQ